MMECNKEYKVTTWKKWNDIARVWEHNHIEDGHVPYAQQYPLPKGDFPLQKQWKNAGWLKRHAYIVNGKLI